MEKIDFRELAQKAKSGADDGIKKVGEAAQKAAVGVNDGIDLAKETLRKNALAKSAVKELQNVIKDLEKENKAKVHGEIKEETITIIEQLKELVQMIKSDPENSTEAMETLANEYRRTIGSMVNSNQEGADLIKMQVMSKRYEDAFKACVHARIALENKLSSVNE